MPPRALAAALLAGVAVWAAHFLLTYLLLTLGCTGALDAAGVWVGAVTALAILLAGAAAAGAARALGRGAHGPAARFVLRAAVVANGFVLLLLLLEALALASLATWCAG